eukprot:jgi/Mesen1/8625/ME000050S08033
MEALLAPVVTHSFAVLGKCTAQIETRTSAGSKSGHLLGSLSQARSLRQTTSQVFRGTQLGVGFTKACKAHAHQNGRPVATLLDSSTETETGSDSMKVIIDNDENEKWTAIQLETGNRPGLLTKITSAFRDLNLQVMRAVVDTMGESVIDKFYVVNTAGEKITSSADIEVVTKVLKSLPLEVGGGLSAAARPMSSYVEHLIGVRDDPAASSRAELAHRLKDQYKRNDVLSLEEDIMDHVEYTLARSRFKFDDYEAYQATAHSIRDRLIESWNDTHQHFREANPKRVFYLSMEFLMGRSLLNSLYNLNIKNLYTEALTQLGYNLETIVEQERDAALGNGGLGRLAACFLDSLATLNYPAWGYGIRYQYGMFRQTLENGFQHEQPDYWLTMSNPWEIERSNIAYPVKFYGVVEQYMDERNYQRWKWTPGEQVQAVAHDNPIPGYGTANTINLRLWAGKPSTEFDLQSFNTGDYVTAILSNDLCSGGARRQRAEAISSVLYPDDRTYQGKELRLKQQHFMVSASLQDILRRYKETNSDLTKLPDKVALQLNDTHPTIGVPELMRLLMDEEGLGWTASWAIVSRVFSFTNHTIVYQINFEFIQKVKAKFGDDFSRMSRMSIIEEGDVKSVRMANLAVVASHTVNGVAFIHSELIKETILKDFYEMWPEKFQNKTNGVTQRRWLAFCNPGLRDLVTEVVGSDAWITDLTLTTALRARASDLDFQSRWQLVKQKNKEKLAALIHKLTGVKVSSRSLFDIQVKRIHEYKRQLLNILQVIYRHDQIKKMSAEEKKKVVPRVVVVGGKAAPGYEMAKRIIKLVSAVGEVVNNDPGVGDLLKVVFLPDYNVSLAEVIIPASDLSQHISTAGTEASGTSNMKFSMNGGLIIGTMDGANVEIREEIGEENMFIFGARAEHVPRLRAERKDFRPDERFLYTLDLLRSNKFGWAEYFTPIVAALDGEAGGDFYLLANDFPSYLEAQARVDATWQDQAKWTHMSIMSTAGCSKFSSDRTIHEYAQEIWNIEPCKLDVSRPPAPGNALHF